MRCGYTITGLLAGLALGAGTAFADDVGSLNRAGIQHVLLISIDGMHAVDFINCAHGVNGGGPYCPNLAALKATGINYLQASTSRPSDSFPGLMAIVSGATPRTMGVFYDVAYDRSLAPPATATGNGLAAGRCTPHVFNGTTTEYEEGIDKAQMFLNGVDANGSDGGVASIDPNKLPRDPANGCAPVYPWNFIRVNTVYGVIHQAGGYTAWSDKHPAYSSVAGPNTKGPANVPENLDDYFAPEINSVPVPLPFPGCSAADDPNFSSLGAYTDSFAFIKCYDMLKVNGVINQIEGFRHNRSAPAPVPTIFGMNFQAVSVGQKLIEPKVGSGGYLDAMGTPTPLMVSEIRFVDEAIGRFVAELRRHKLADSTLLIITAKHGQSPVDTQHYIPITDAGPVTTSPSRLLANCLPASESPAANQIGPTEDDVSLLWLRSGCSTAEEVSDLETQSPASNNIAGIGQILWGASLRQMFNAPGLPPNDPRSPDIVVTPDIGVTYSKSTAKHAEHGGFAHDDTNVMLLLVNPHFEARTLTTPVETAQVAPTILKALGLSPASLEAVQREGTQVLPGVPFGADNP
jgi:Type I phosphodiesterase / nucleotide pyrophosphatase